MNSFSYYFRFYKYYCTFIIIVFIEIIDRGRRFKRMLAFYKNHFYKMPVLRGMHTNAIERTMPFE